MPTKTKTKKEEYFIPLKPLLLTEILLRDFGYVALKILLLLIRLSDGCKGMNSSIDRLGCITLMKKDFEVLGFPKQTITNKIKDLVQKDVIFVEKIQLAIKFKETNVYYFSINPNFSDWKVPYSNPNLDKLVHLNLSLEPINLHRINNVNRYKQVLLELQKLSPLEYLLEKYRIFYNLNEHIISTFFVMAKNRFGKNYSVIGYDNVIYEDKFIEIQKRSSIQQFLLASFILDLQLLLKIRVIENQDVPNAMYEIIADPVPHLTALSEFWLKNIAEFPEDIHFQPKLNQILECYNGLAPLKDDDSDLVDRFVSFDDYSNDFPQHNSPPETHYNYSGEEEDDDDDNYPTYNNTQKYEQGGYNDIPD